MQAAVCIIANFGFVTVMVGFDHKTDFRQQTAVVSPAMSATSSTTTTNNAMHHHHHTSAAEFFFFGLGNNGGLGGGFMGDPGWDINDAELPRVLHAYDEFDEWSTGHRKLVYRPDDEEAKRHSSGWAMRNTNNHNVAILKKSCLGVLVCNCDCTGPHGEKVHIRPAICDKARRKQLSKSCSTPGCMGRLMLMPCRGHCGYPVTHFWRHTPHGIYFQSKGHHDHPQPESKAYAEARRSMSNHQAKRKLTAATSSADENNGESGDDESNFKPKDTAEVSSDFKIDRQQRKSRSKRIRFVSEDDDVKDTEKPLLLQFDDTSNRQQQISVSRVAATFNDEQQQQQLQFVVPPPAMHEVLPPLNHHLFLPTTYYEQHINCPNSLGNAIFQPPPPHELLALPLAPHYVEQRSQPYSFTGNGVLLDDPPQQEHLPENYVAHQSHDEQSSTLYTAPTAPTAPMQSTVWYLHTAPLSTQAVPRHSDDRAVPPSAVFDLANRSNSTALYVPIQTGPGEAARAPPQQGILASSASTDKNLRKLKYHFPKTFESMLVAPTTHNGVNDTYHPAAGWQMPTNSETLMVEPNINFAVDLRQQHRFAAECCSSSSTITTTHSHKSFFNCPPTLTTAAERMAVRDEHIPQASSTNSSNARKWRLTAKYIPLGVFRYEGLQLERESS